MLKKRIIPCLDIHEGRTVKGVSFQSLRDAGDPVALAAQYATDGADELVFLDISATIEGRTTFTDLVEDIAAEINIPFTVGGGIQSIHDVERLIKRGADKVSVNSAAVYHPELINELALEFGSQCITVAIDTLAVDEVEYVFTRGGRDQSDKHTMSWIQEVEDRGAGELLITSIRQDGQKSGFALDIYKQVRAISTLPLIASGGAGSIQHFEALFKNNNADAGLAASIFHYGEIPVPVLKDALHTLNIPIRI